MSEFAAARFSAPERRMRLVVERALGLVDAAAPLRVLDIACGDGSHALALAQALPRARVLGVDISAPNIAAAEAARASHPAGSRAEFRLADYLAGPCGSFDLILSIGGVNYIPTDAETLFAKIDAELAPGGTILLTTPSECFYNRALLALRALFRALRCPALDAAGLWVANRMHGGEFSERELQERLMYLYTGSRLLDSPDVRALTGRLGWNLELDEPVEHASPAQLKHRLLAWKKPGTP